MNKVNYDLTPNSHRTMIGDINVCWDWDTYGGGMHFGKCFLPALGERYPQRIFNNALEWCSGDGCIGWGLLAAGVCKQIAFNDIFHGAIDHLNTTVEENPHVQGRTSIYHGDNIIAVDANEKFDLIVGNPPHLKSNNELRSTDPHQIRRDIDPNLDTHREFFNNVKNYLTEDGVILFLERMDTTPADFRKMVEDNDLVISDTFPVPWGHRNMFWFLEVKHKEAVE